MSLLTPLYIAGLLAISLPVLFHLIRRTPQGELPFSSLMFLSPSPPRMTRRSRLDNLLLLLLRALALALLAVAFARPFFRQAAQLDRGEVTRQRTAILLDTSASMRRGDLWSQALGVVDEVLDGGEPNDERAIFTFDETLKPLVGFDELDRIEPYRHRAIIESRLKSLGTTWAATQLGQVLMDAVDAVNDVIDTSEEESRIPRRLVLISDLQQGGRLDSLGDYQWPRDVTLELRQVKPAAKTNAGLHRLSAGLPTESQRSAGQTAVASLSDSERVRVSNDANSQTDEFSLQWYDDQGAKQGEAIDVYVPAGESRVVHAPRPAGGSNSVRLTLFGDDHDFDNSLFITPRRRGEVGVVYMGNDDVDDPNAQYYYLDRALVGNSLQDIQINKLPDGELKAQGETLSEALAHGPELVVATTEISETTAQRLVDYATGGGKLLIVVGAAATTESLAQIMGVPSLDVEEVTPAGYTMLGEISFRHPLFAPLAGPQFNDFTKIRYWKYRRLDAQWGEDVQVLARFENGDPALIERRLGKGSVLLLGSGWAPDDSQLARSTKFVPLMLSLLRGERDARAEVSHYLVNGNVPLSAKMDDAASISVRKPDGGTWKPEEAGESFGETDLPGIYEVMQTEEQFFFAVNLDPAESNTAPLPQESFEQLGSQLVGEVAGEQSAELLRQMRDVELESRQKIWQWLIVAALCVLIVETWLSARLTKISFTQMETVKA